MPRLDGNTVVANAQFTPIGIERLAASGYTLAGLVVDDSGSVQPFAHLIEDMMETIRESLFLSPHVDNLLLRSTVFSRDIREVHGFELLHSIPVGKYKGAVNQFGSTNLFDATFNGLTSIEAQGISLVDNGFGANGILFVVTDGMCTHSKVTPTQIRQRLQAMLKTERLESMRLILVGVNINDPDVHDALDTFQKEAGFDQFIAIENATKEELAKLAGFVSVSISSQSNALGSGTASKPITF